MNNFMNDQEWEKYLKSKVEEFEFPYNDQYWQEVQKRLPQKKQKSFRFEWSIGILALLVLTFGSLWFIFNTNDNTDELIQKHFYHKPILPKNIIEKNSDFSSKKQNENIFSPKIQLENKNTNYKQFSNNFLKSKSSLEKSLIARKKSAELLVNKEKIAAICKTILIYKALKINAQKYIPLENAQEFVFQLEALNTKKLLSQNNNELNLLNIEKTQKEHPYIEKKIKWGLGSGFISSRFTGDKNLFFRQFISAHLEYPISTKIFIQSLPQISFGNTLNIGSQNSKIFALHLPFEIAYHQYRYSLAAGLQYDYFFLNTEQKQSLNTSRILSSFAFESQYHQFKLRLAGQYSLNNLSKWSNVQKEWRFLVGLYYIFLSK